MLIIEKMDTPEIIEDFYGVYLLYCLNEKYLGRTYIGYTVDPNRRINQHNRGVWAGGARRTSNRGPWKMIMIIHGFPNNISALRFEWAWQNPEQSRRFLHVANRKKLRNEKQLEYRLRILSEMLRVGPWNRLPLTVRWLAEDFAKDFPPDKLPPLHMPICNSPVKSKKRKDSSNTNQNSKNQEWKTKTRESKSTNRRKDKKTNRNNESDSGDSDAGNVDLNNGNGMPDSDNKYLNELCSLCHRLIEDSKFKLSCLNNSCDLISHVNCLAEIFLERGEYVPVDGDCPFCSQNLLWGDLIRKMKGCRDVEFGQEPKHNGVCDGEQDGGKDIWTDVYDDIHNVSKSDGNYLNKSLSCDESDIDIL